MKDILTATFVKEMMETTANMYRLGWDERNGGNISYLLDEDEVREYLNLNRVIRTIPTGFDAKPLIGKIFIVTGTGKYFKNVEKDPETNLGIVRIASDGTTAELLWGYKDGGKFTSEFPAHMMSHMARLTVDPANRVVMHCHPTNTLAMNYVHELDEKKLLNGDVIDGIMMEDKKEVNKVILTGAELSKYFGKETTPREMKDQIIKLLDDWKGQQKEHEKPEKKTEQEK